MLLYDSIYAALLCLYDCLENYGIIIANIIYFSNLGIQAKLMWAMYLRFICIQSVCDTTTFHFDKNK